MNIPLNDVESYLASGWVNSNSLDISRLVAPGIVLTVILSDEPFDVPDPLPGGINLLGSKQHLFEGGGLVKIRVLERT